MIKPPKSRDPISVSFASEEFTQGVIGIMEKMAPIIDELADDGQKEAMVAIGLGAFFYYMCGGQNIATQATMHSIAVTMAHEVIQDELQVAQKAQA